MNTMSTVNHVPSSEAVAEALYRIVCPMLASKNCVKCVSASADCVFTTDVHCLLSHMDIEHPVGEFILQALDAHNKKYGTSLKTLLFMITGIAKVVSQLRSLGVPAKKSLQIIKASVAELMNDVQAIAIPVATSLDMKKEEGNSSQDSHDAVTVREFLGQVELKDHNRHLKETVICSADQKTVNCETPCPVEKFSCNQKSVPLSETFFHLPGSSLNKKNGLLSMDTKSINFSESDPVVLKMSVAQNSIPDDDVSWFFDSSSNPLANHQASHAPEYGVISTFKDSYAGAEFLKLTNGSTMPLSESSSENSNLVRLNLQGNEKEKCRWNEGLASSKLSKEQDMNPLIFDKKKEDYDSDFDDCFDDDENRKHFSLKVENVSPISTICDSKGGEDFILLHNARKHFSSVDFDDVPTMSFYDRHLEENSSNNVKDEFSDCFDDLNHEDVDVTCSIKDQIILHSSEAIALHPCEMEERNKESAKNVVNPIQEIGSRSVNKSSGVSKVEQHNGTGNNSSDRVNMPEGKIDQTCTVRKLNSMLDLVVKASDKNSSPMKMSQSNGMKTRKFETGVSEHIKDTLMINHTNTSESYTPTSVVRRSTAKVEINLGERYQEAQSSDHHDVLRKILSEKKSTYKAKISHQIAISSRHFSNSEVNSVSENITSTNADISPSIDLSKSESCQSIVEDQDDHSKHSHDAGMMRHSFLKECFKSDPTVVCSDNEFPPSLCQSQGLLLPRDTHLFVDPEVSRTVEQLLRHQKQDKKFSEFNLKLVDCFCVAVLPSAIAEFESSVAVLPGLILPCDLGILQKLQKHFNVGVGKALLVKADLTPSHHHKGYKSTLANKVFVSSPSESGDDGSENSWASSVLTAAKELGINVLLVKGNIQEKLLNQLESAGVLALANVSYHTLSVLAYVQNVDMVTYVPDACAGHVCDVELQPFSESWMDYLDERNGASRHYMKIINSSAVQTVVLSHQSKMGTCLAEERLWKNLHKLSNVVKDKKVLPGAGKTETWCAQVLEKKARSYLENNKGLHHAVIDSLSQVFWDYSTCVQSNSCRESEGVLVGSRQRHKEPTQSVDENPTSKFSPITHFQHNSHCRSVFQPKEAFEPWGGMNALDSETPSFFYAHRYSKTEHSFGKQVSDKLQVSVYDNFLSKVEAWEAAADVVSVLSKLNSLVITGIDRTSLDKNTTVL